MVLKICQSYHVLKAYLFIPTRESKQVAAELAIKESIFILSHLLSSFLLLSLRNDQNASNDKRLGATLTRRQAIKSFLPSLRC